MTQKSTLSYCFIFYGESSSVYYPRTVKKQLKKVSLWCRVKIRRIQVQVLVVQTLNSTIQQISDYRNQFRYPLDKDLSSG